MSGTIRRGTPARTPRRAVRQRKVSVMDRVLSVLPVSETTLRRAVTWTIVAGVAGAGFAVASFFGVPGAVGIAAAEAAGRAGFRVEQIEVTGLKRMDRMSVYAVALDQQSRAMPLVDIEAVRAKLLQYGWIEDAHVSRRLPDTLLVHIVERKPAAIWQAHGNLTLIDATGVPLEAVSREAMPDLPLVIGRGANLQEANYQALLGQAPALKPLVRAASWVGNRRWDLLFTTGETLMLPEGDEKAATALVKFAEMDGADRLLGRNWVRFDMRGDGRMLARSGGGRDVVKPTAEDAPAPAKTEDTSEQDARTARRVSTGEA
ncbi:MAG: cell division protein FtsQ/DivIB [Pseudomonadota bacterium]